ncbi:MAG TPA: alpha/beta hydrolase [Vicinamibacterales bacterium]|nr:alpha/beta hydrolase [Vicinamibacterales bacterium]
MAKERRGVWGTIRWIWIRVGALAGIIFVVWSVIAYRATSQAHDALKSDARVEVTDRSDYWAFAPRQESADVGLIFYAGALVDPAAYAPLAHAVADRGYPVLLIRLPRRGAFGGADGAAPLTRAIEATLSVPVVKRWVASGHSRGGKVASELVRTRAGSLVGLILIGTSHPRDFSLANSTIPVTRIFGTRDTVADLDKVMAVRKNLPPDTRDVRIDGANHSQFGYYGFQPGDWPATITRAEQQRLTLEAVLSTLGNLSSDR